MPTKAELKSLTAAMDSDQTGKIDFASFLNAMAGFLKPQYGTEKIDDAFDEIAGSVYTYHTFFFFLVRRCGRMKLPLHRTRCSVNFLNDIHKQGSSCSLAARNSRNSSLELYRRVAIGQGTRCRYVVDRA